MAVPMVHAIMCVALWVPLSYRPTASLPAARGRPPPSSPNTRKHPAVAS